MARRSQDALDGGYAGRTAHLAVIVGIGVALLGCERMSLPPCPQNAVAVGRPAAESDEATAVRYFPELSPRSFRRWGADELLLWGEPPLSDAGNGASYRVLEAGAFGRVLAMKRFGSTVQVRLKRWSPCDEGTAYGAAREVVEGAASLGAWSRVDACMERWFWHTEPERGDGKTFESWVTACGPGQLHRRHGHRRDGRVRAQAGSRRAAACSGPRSSSPPLTSTPPQAWRPTRAGTSWPLATTTSSTTTRPSSPSWRRSRGKRRRATPRQTRHAP